MALQSEVAPPIVGDINKDTKLDGETKSDEPDTAGDTEEGEDLEEGEILDSGEEEDSKTNDDKCSSPAIDSSNSEVAKPGSVAQDIHEIFNLAEKVAVLQQIVGEKGEKRKTGNVNNSHGKKKIKSGKYVDHDHNVDNEEEEDEEEEEPWYKPRTANFKEGPIDYRKELAAYRGSSSSPDRNHGEVSGKRSHDAKNRKKRKKNALSTRGKKLSAKRRRMLEINARKGRKKDKIKKMCKFYMEGKCAKGNDCPFSHSGSPYRKKELCKFYLNGYCSKGKLCVYMHDDFPCKFFHTGSRCYADENCRFSHKPLTEESKKLLDDYLKSYHGDDYDPRKRPQSNSPEPKAKRPCILGSPPRHIREAEETKRWQEEMLQLQKNQGTGAFGIHLSPGKQFGSPSKFTRPNFYMDTMQGSSSPQKLSSLPNIPNSMTASNATRLLPRLKERSMGKEEKKEDHNNFDWRNICALVEKLSAPKDNSVDLEEPTKPDETKPEIPKEASHSEDVESATDYDECLSPRMGYIDFSVDDASNDNNIVQKLPIEGSENDSEPQSASGFSLASLLLESAAQDTTPLEPIIIPSHLPRKQRELLMRIQKHQKSNSTTDDPNDIPDSEKSESENQLSIAEDRPIKEEEEVKSPEKENEAWYSSEDDDDGSDVPLTDVLKKIQQTPPLKAKLQPPPVPPISITEMLSNIMQKANPNTQSSSLYNEQDSFWKTILSGTVPSAEKATTTPLAAAKPIGSVKESSSGQPPALTKRRTLLPDPRTAPIEKVIPDTRDPRLKNRDPRTAASMSVKSQLAVSNTPISKNPPLIPSVETRTENHIPSRNRDLNSVIPNQPPALVVEGMKANIPYKLHGVSAKPLNYLPYVQASMSNPKLLNDPRLRKHLIQRTNSVSVNQSGSEKNVESSSSLRLPIPLTKPSILPDLPIFSQIKHEKSDCFPPTLQDNRFTSGIKSPPRLDMPTLPPELKLPPPAVPKVSDPRTRRMDQQGPHRRLSGNSTPPHTLASEATWMPPTSTVVPTHPASHLPRAIADPRMAKLHHPLDPRRPRAVPEAASKPAALLTTPAALLNKPAALLTAPAALLTTPAALLTTPTALLTTPAALLTTPTALLTTPAALLTTPASVLSKPPAANEEMKTLSPVLENSVKIEPISVPEIKLEENADDIKVPSKRRKSLGENNCKKNKAVHRNRKSSMDYASPLNSCDDSNTSSNLGYNSYNQRPKKRNVNLLKDTMTEKETTTSSSDILELIPLIPTSDFSTSDNSNLEGDNADINASLKDMFKTIDPTASPFC